MNGFTRIPESRWLRSRDLKLEESSAPASFYTSQEQFELEREQVFRRAWLSVARVEELPNAGDFVNLDILTLKAKLILVRGDDGEVRGFHNSCAHRGVMVVQKEKGNAAQFRCPYHAWVYGTDGKLRTIPGADMFPDVKCGHDGLPPVHTGIWNGFIFVNFAKEPEESLEEFLGEAGVLFSDLPFEDYNHELRLPQPLATNWKHISNAFTEGYHLGFLHKNSLPFVFDRENPLTDYPTVRFMGRHSANITGANSKWQPTKPVMRFALETGFAADAELEPAGKKLMDHPAINPDRIDPIMEEAINIFPNTQIQVLRNGYLWYQYWPSGPNEMLWDVRLFLDRAPHSFRTEFAEASYVAASRDVMAEDSSMGELQQQGLISGGLERVKYGENEFMLRHFAQTLTNYIEGKV